MKEGRKGTKEGRKGTKGGRKGANNAVGIKEGGVCLGVGAREEAYNCVGVEK